MRSVYGAPVNEECLRRDCRRGALIAWAHCNVLGGGAWQSYQLERCKDDASRRVLLGIGERA